MTGPVDLSALPPRQRAALLLSAARSDLAERLWRAALGSASDKETPEPWRPVGASALPRTGDALAALTSGRGKHSISFDALIAALGQKAIAIPETTPARPCPLPTGAPQDRDRSVAASSLPPAMRGLGANDRYADALSAAAACTGIPGSALAAIIDAEAARGPDGGWNPMSRNPRSSAAGLGQFLNGTWLDMAKREGTWLNGLARQRGLIDATGQIGREGRSALLTLRYDPTVAIETVADYARANVDRLRRSGVSVGTTPRAIARAAYIGHHLGPGDARRFYNGTISAQHARYLLSAQIGADEADRRIADSGDAAQAHRRWLMSHVTHHVRAELYADTGPAPTAGPSATTDIL